MQDIVSWFTNASSSVPSDDPVLLTTLFDFCRNLHDTFDSLSPSAEVKQKAKLLVHFIEKVNFGKNFEQQLNFYVECRHKKCFPVLLLRKFYILFGPIYVFVCKLVWMLLSISLIICMFVSYYMDCP